jgi:ABC-type antimicrobial peptide transport system permease subunit
MLGAFALVAVVLAGIGVYVVVAYATARRAREIAVRRALGASGCALVTQVVREGVGWIGLGLAVGAFGALALSGSIESQLCGVRPADPVTFGAVGAILALVACAAAALRAARVDPMLALRSE